MENELVSTGELDLKGKSSLLKLGLLLLQFGTFSVTITDRNESHFIGWETWRHGNKSYGARNRPGTIITKLSKCLFILFLFFFT